MTILKFSITSDYFPLSLYLSLFSVRPSFALYLLLFLFLAVYHSGPLFFLPLLIFRTPVLLIYLSINLFTSSISLVDQFFPYIFYSSIYGFPNYFFYLFTPRERKRQKRSKKREKRRGKEKEREKKRGVRVVVIEERRGGEEGEYPTAPFFTSLL